LAVRPAAAGAPKKNAAHLRGVFVPGRSPDEASGADYFEIERLNMRSIFSFVASQQDWLA
jgi:hypothetical protein